ncbi:RIP metalloprotease RseP [Thioflexithrix psekupsensis]|uniref:Zinc metalloprotease n=1 Tax=Thioflexithrix psekupsensis TaxID=1570016 RepID=A0A251XCG2_9GAMM|nr:RIP metalloprotease RseP [Thioflexithrix psekupsensis]OUD15736.1 RIP metalloprotease RseP [Thioflexithrix psekupsensis]
MSLLYMIIAFLVAIGLLVAVHEFGHYWVARRSGVKILCFSIGFGQTLWSKRFGTDQTEFVIAAIPLGGYVKMLDEREAPVAPEEQHRAFNRQSLGVRSAIVLAGPLFNLVLAVSIYTLVYMIGLTGTKAVIGEVTPGGLAEQAGFRSGYQVVAVDGREVLRWESVIQATLSKLLDQELIAYRVLDKTGTESLLYLDMRHLTLDDISEGQFFSVAGFWPRYPPLPAQLGEVVVGSPAAEAGLQVGDVIVAVNHEPISTWKQWSGVIAAHPESPMLVRIRRGEQLITLTVTPARTESGEGRIGVRPQRAEIPAEYLITERHAPWTALWLSLEKTVDLSVLTLRVMYKMLTLQLSTRNISGPITIANYAGQSAQTGVISFLMFLGLISLSLGIINLLPIPLLDGGHLLLYFIEWVKGSPVSETAQVWLYKIGLTFIVLLMTLAIFNDIDRFFR